MYRNPHTAAFTHTPTLVSRLLVRIPVYLKSLFSQHDQLELLHVQSRNVPRPTVVSGFTLLELLVVLAIIGLVASVGLASLSAARVKARNANRLQEITAYAKAAELHFAEERQYPGSSSSYRCLGYASAESCPFGSGSIAGDDTLLSNFSGVFNGQPPEGNPAGLGGYTGYHYACTTSACTGYMIRYMLEGTGQSCASGSLLINASFGSTNTYCQVVQCELGTSPSRTSETSAYSCS